MNIGGQNLNPEGECLTASGDIWEFFPEEGP